MELISIIVPVYKAEKYLDRCITSIVNQTYSNLEILLVDDGSPDNCPAICDVWAETDPRIRVIHKENGGASSARNAGLSAASGDYIGFVDSDDWICPVFYETLHKLIGETGADLAECAFVKTEGSSTVPESTGALTICSDEEAMRLHMNVKMFKQVIWNKLYKRSIVTVLFDEDKYHEDEFWTYQIIANCKKLVHIDLCLYFYFQHSDSLMGAKYSAKRIDAYEAKFRRNAFVREHYPTIPTMSDLDIWNSCIYNGQVLLQRADRSEWRAGFTKLKALCPRNTSFQRKKITHYLWLILAKYNLMLCCKLRNYLQIGL